MKRVKECGECGYYNRLTRMECSRCRKRIDNVPIISVDDNLTENPNLGVNTQDGDSAKESTATVERAQQNEQGEARCKYCGEVNVFPADEDLVFCGKCRRLILRDEAEWLSDNGSEKSELKSPDEAVLSGDKISLIFTSVFGKGEFVLTFIAEQQVFGRWSCDRDFVHNNKFISREHIRYFYRDGQAYIADISNNGTFINEERLSKGKEYVLKAGDRLKLSNEEFIIKNVG